LEKGTPEAPLTLPACLAANPPTLVTGVWPAEHGVQNNGRFDPENNLSGAWYWYAGQVKVPTLWSAARAAGLPTASVSWPATADAGSIDTLIPAERVAQRRIQSRRPFLNECPFAP
jgi:predicted AlkP superfamily pyrophosphatase or phosphodiesterase